MNPNQPFEHIYPDWLLVPESLRVVAEISLAESDPHTRMIALYTVAETHLMFLNGIGVGDVDGQMAMADAVAPFNDQIWSKPLKEKAVASRQLATKVAVWHRDHGNIEIDCVSVFVLRRRKNELFGGDPVDGIAGRQERPDELDRMIGRQQSRTTLADELIQGTILHFVDAAGNRGAEVIRLRRFEILPGPDRDFGDYQAAHVEWLNPRHDHEAGTLAVDPETAQIITDEIDHNARAWVGDWSDDVDETLIDLRDSAPVVTASSLALGATTGQPRGTVPTGEHLLDGLLICGQPTDPTMLAASIVRAAADEYGLTIPVVSLSEPALNYVTEAPDDFGMEGWNSANGESPLDLLPYQHMDDGQIFHANCAGPGGKPSESQLRVIDRLVNGQIQAETTQAIENLLSRVGTFGDFHQGMDRQVIDGLIDVRLAANLTCAIECLT